MVIRSLIRASDTGEMPEGIDATWQWRNAANQDVREDDFLSAVEGSRKGFITLMRRRLARDLDRALMVEQLQRPPQPKAPKKRKPTARKKPRATAPKKRTPARKRKPARKRRARR